MSYFASFFKNHHLPCSWKYQNRCDCNIAFIIHSVQLWQSSWTCYLYTVDIVKCKKKSLFFFSFSDALHYQIRGKHVFPNAVISQRYKLQPYHNEKGMQSAACLSAWKMFTVSKRKSVRHCSNQHAIFCGSWRNRQGSERKVSWNYNFFGKCCSDCNPCFCKLYLDSLCSFQDHILLDQRKCWRVKYKLG